MSTNLCTMPGRPSNGSPAGMSARAVAGRSPLGAAYAASPAAQVPAAWRKITAAGLRATHLHDAVFTTPAGSGGSG